VKVIVTGAAGMLGCAVLAELERAGHDAVGVDRNDGDIGRPGALDHAVRAFAPDWVFHLAAYTRVDDCESHADEAYRVNALGSRNVAVSAARGGASLLAVSTDYVFDGLGRRPYREYDEARPRSVYGASKWAGEQAVRELHPRHAIVRTAWLYGAGGVHFVDTILRRARAGEPLRVVDDQRGSPTWTGDLAPALVRLAAGDHFGTFHVTNSGECTWHELASEAVARAGLAVEVARATTAEIARPAPRPAYSVLSTRMYEEVTGARMPAWQDALRRYLESEADV
jgi:dTDP-4-dehydrorhamnose reductase